MNSEDQQQYIKYRIDSAFKTFENDSVKPLFPIVFDMLTEIAEFNLQMQLNSD